jgi:phosphotriesterase-related protein
VWTCSTSSSSTISKNGIAGSGVRPGILKCATDEQGLTPGVERVLRAVARVHRRTGLPISTHTHAHSRRGLDQQRVFTEEGVDLSRVVIGHSGDSHRPRLSGELLRAGSTLGMDRFGVDAYCPTEKRVETVARLCEAGWTDHMVLSHDAGCHMDWFDDDFLQQVQPNWNFLHISQRRPAHDAGPGRQRGPDHAMLVDTRVASSITGRGY